jgi:hypothetical protein
MALQSGPCCGTFCYQLGEWEMGARSLSADTRKDAGDEAIKDERKQQRSDEEGWRPMKVERDLVGSDLRR